MNNQAIEKRVVGDGLTLDVVSVFHTIQGEGPFCGTPAVFIRLAGCNLQCPGCDTDYTTTRGKRHLSELLVDVSQLAPSGLVVITGGEPFRQPICHLLDLLVSQGYFVQVESNGTLRPCVPFARWNHNTTERAGAYLVVSPKSGTLANGVWSAACAAKYVMSEGSRMQDGLPGSVLGLHCNSVARPPQWWSGPVYLQPMDAKDASENQLNLDACVTSCLENGYILQLQIHKLINLE